MRSSGIRYRRAFAVALALCTSAFIGLVSATPAQAAPPGDHQNFFPNDRNALEDETSTNTIFLDEYLSDREDGKGTEAHLTVVATPDTSIVIWYVCPSGVAGDNTNGPLEVTQGELDTCTEIGRDDTPTQPQAPGAGFPPPLADEAYETGWNIDPGLDDLIRDIVSLACTSTPTAGAEITDGDCRDEAENDLYLDNAGTGTVPSSGAAEWHLWCQEPCDVDPAGSARFDFIHGDNWPSDGAVALDVEASARTSPDIDEVSSHIFATVDGPTEYAAGDADDSISDTSADVVSPTFSLFEDQEHNVPPSDEMSVILADNDDDSYAAPTGATNDCDADTPEECAWDAHYVVSLPEDTVGQTHIHNDSDTAAADQDLNAGAPVEDVCEEQDRTKTGDVSTDTPPEPLIGCVFNSFSEFQDLDGDGDLEKDMDQALVTEATFEITTGNAGFADPVAPFGTGGADTTGTEFCEGTLGGGSPGPTHDHDGDGIFEHCHLAVADWDDVGEANKAEADFVAVATGAINAVFCVDLQQDQPTNANHGCADAATAEKDTATKNSEAEFDHAHLLFSEDDTPTCIATGSKNKPAGSNVNLTGCAHDSFHNGAAGVPVIWRIISGPGNFVTVEQATDASGEADATFTAPSATNGQVTTIDFCLDGTAGFAANGVCDAEEGGPPAACPGCKAQVQITWTAAVTGGTCPEVGGYSVTTGTNGDDKITGSKDCDKLKGKKGDDVLKGRSEDDFLKGGPGDDVLKGGPGNDICRGGPGKDTKISC